MRVPYLRLVLLHCCSLAAVAVAQKPVAVEHVQRIANIANPELMYVFMQRAQLERSAWMQNIDMVAKQGTFDFLFLTERDGANFYDFSTMHPIFKDLVAEAHAHHIRVGLQLWPRLTDIPDADLQGIVVEQELQLDDKGHAEYTAVSRGVRRSSTTGGASPGADQGGPIYAAVSSQLLRIYAFRKTADSEYAPGTVADITSSAHVSANGPSSVMVRIDNPRFAGYTAYVMTVHYHQYPDLFSDFLPHAFAAAMEAYRDVGFDGAALDEFRYMTLDNRTGELFRERLYSPAMAAYFKQHTGMDLDRTLFDMRYSPSGTPAPRVRAIDNYFDVLRQGPLRVERAFYDSTVRTFGSHAFHGIHDTFHNALDNDEIWATGINWWAIPRDYGQTDETTPMTTRLGIGMAHPKPVEYNQYYTRDLHRFLEEGIMDARFNVRVHYHALNDMHGWGIDLANPELEKGIAAVEDKVRLLNRFDAPRPKTNVLFLFGYPSLANWFQPGGERNRWDINGAMHAEEKAEAAWDAGYRGPLAPSYLIESGGLRVDSHGGILFGGERFTALVYIGPQYLKQSTLRFLLTFVDGGGKLLLDGTATMDFNGNDVRAQFRQLAAKAVATTFSIDAMDRLMVPKLAIDEGAVYQDGSVVLADLDSLLSGTPKPFSIESGGHRFTGSYIGLIALKSDAGGNILKLAAGGLQKLSRDGRPILTLSVPSDLVLMRDARGGYASTIVGDATLKLWH